MRALIWIAVCTLSLGVISGLNAEEALGAGPIATDDQVMSTATTLGETGPSQRGRELSADQAVKAAVQADPGVQSAIFDWMAASAKAEAAQWKRMPSLNAFSSYTRLSDLGPQSITIGTAKYDLSATPLDNWSFGINLQFTVFAGFRIQEAAALADLQADGKLLASEGAKRALVFEVRRAYWEAVRADQTILTLEKNLELATAIHQQTQQQLQQGVITEVQMLAAAQRLNQAQQDLNDARSNSQRGRLVLTSLIGIPAPRQSALAGSLILTDSPDAPSFTELNGLTESAAVDQALKQRPETRSAGVAQKSAQHALGLAAAPLYPTVALTGNLLDANPNQRMLFESTPQFTPSWQLGVQISYDLGAIPGTLKELEAARLAAQKVDSDSQKQANQVSLDVRSCLLTTARLRQDLDLMKTLENQALENQRVAQQKLLNGLVNTISVLEADFNLLKTRYTILNKQIDLQIAQADLARAMAVDSLP